MTGAVAFSIIAVNLFGLIAGALYALACIARGGE